MPVKIIFIIYILVGAFAFSYIEFSLLKIVSGGLFGASLGVNELKDGSSFTTVAIGVIGAFCMLLSMVMLGLFSKDHYLTFYLFGIVASIVLFFVHTR